ncbi:MAG: tetratricopeptide repeat protein [Burkholderiaceae bacterium]
MSPTTPEASFTLRRVQEMLGLSRGAVSRLIGAGFVTPTRGPRNEHRFSFQDLMLLRTAQSLLQADVPARKILRALTKLQASLPDELPLTGLRITAVGANVVVRDRAGPRDADSGQLLMDFEVAPVGTAVTFLPPSPSLPASRTAASWFERGEAAEATDIQIAEAAYRQAIALEPGDPGAYLNLGAMLCDHARCDDAVTLYEQALQHCADEPLIHFNRAIALEDQGRDREAVSSYERCLALSPEVADAHYNIGCLLDKLGDRLGAVRHFSAYRRVERRKDQ